jgi:ATP-binding protein involved in chromosome partitioning
LEAWGIRFISMANLVTENTPMIWRGAMVHSVLTQFLNQVLWGVLDVLVIDLPPGTGDASLTLAQAVPLSGLVVVTTPQELSVADTARGLNAFRQMRVPILGLVENMSSFTCSHCGEESPLFGRTVADWFCEELEVPLLARLPVDPSLPGACDEGKPLALTQPEQPFARRLMALVDQLLMKLEADQGVHLFHLEWQDAPAVKRQDKPRELAGGDLLLQAVWQASDRELGLAFLDGSCLMATPRQLRLACPCAACVDEWSGRPLLAAERVGEGLGLIRLESVGRYALRLYFDDGHDSGLYSFERLRSLVHAL